MPDKEGSDDEKKSTKSVVNKRQKQMMGEEGYDIARDMGKVSPSKDKKDATTMPVSDEVKKTQKKSKGKSAVELVKAKYGKSVMNVGKKKANEELDLSKVAEAFGGYIVEAPTKKPSYAYSRELGRGKSATDKIVKRALKAFPPEGQKLGSQEDPEVEKQILSARMDKGAMQQAGRDQLDDLSKSTDAASGGKRKGEGKAPTLSPTSSGRKIKKTLSPLDQKRKDYLDPKTNKASPEGVRKYITKARQMRSGSNVPVDPETTEVIATSASKEYEDKINQKYGGRRARRRQSTATPPAFATRTGESGGPLPVSMRNKRVPKTSSIVPVDTNAIVPTKQTTIPKPEEKPEVKSNETEVKPQPTDTGFGGTRPPRKINKKFGPPKEPPKGPSEVAKSYAKFAKKNPALGFATYDIGKGILSKIMKLRGPGLQGGKAGFRSAGR